MPSNPPPPAGHKRPEPPHCPPPPKCSRAASPPVEAKEPDSGGSVAAVLLLALLMSGCPGPHNRCSTVTLYGADGAVVKRWQAVGPVRGNQGSKSFNEWSTDDYISVQGNISVEPGCEP